MPPSIGRDLNEYLTNTSHQAPAQSGDENVLLIHRVTVRPITMQITDTQRDKPYNGRFNRATVFPSLGPLLPGPARFALHFNRAG